MIFAIRPSRWGRDTERGLGGDRQDVFRYIILSTAFFVGERHYNDPVDGGALVPSFIETWLLHTGDSRWQQAEASPIGVIYSTLFQCDERHFWKST
jgi:hypothetical protein